MLAENLTCWGDSCSRPATVFDHIKPGVDGGSDRYANLQPLCERCHTKKTMIENSKRDIAANKARAGAASLQPSAITQRISSSWRN